MAHVVLLGDSIFDNGAYVGGGPDVIAQLQEALPQGHRATLLAQDGAVTAGVRTQIGRLPGDATHLVISVGGNDALSSSGILGEPARSVAEVLGRLADIRERFARDYRAMLDAALATRLNVSVCTVYDPRFADPEQRRLSTLGLAVFNDTITREAFSRGLALFDLRLICNEDADFANPIEPSVQGAAKMATAIAGYVAGNQPPTSAVVARPR